MPIRKKARWQKCPYCGKEGFRASRICLECQKRETREENRLTILPLSWAFNECR